MREQSIIENGQGAAVTINGIAVPIDSFIPIEECYLPRSYFIAQLNGIELGLRSWELLNTPIPELMKRHSKEAANV